MKWTQPAGMILLAIVALLVINGCAPQETGDEQENSTRIVQDMWGREVEIKEEVTSAVIIEWEGLAAKSMQIFGIQEMIVGVDDYAKKNTFRNHVVPVVGTVPDIGSAWSGVNYETLANLKPDVVFMELWVTNESEKELHSDAINKIEELGIPVITFLSPSCFEEPHIDTAWEHVRLVGEVFQKQEEAAALIQRMDEKVALIRSRTQGIEAADKADVVIFATMDNVMGTKSIQSYFLTEIINANNLIEGGDFVKISEEQLLKLDPDVLIIHGHDGYLDPAVVREGRQAGLNWGNVQHLQAIENDRFISLGYEEWRATIETPVALLKMAKTIYPDLFEDIDLEAEEVNMYMQDYGMTREEALKAIEAQRYTAIVEVN
ncbi:ABC transporter substrate-binding protein [Anoxynatronum sibiricum]|uniref:ABC transporter substrate-binding protein n=1 Tax=Anoxynatronum sibiricum TaxID=210623 RepID=A0ABU9VWL8_9CLOT